MFRSQPVVDGDYDGRELASETAADDVVGLDIRAEIDEPATVKEDDNGQLRVITFSKLSGYEEAEPKVARGVDSDVGSPDAFDRIGVGRRSDPGFEEPEEAAVNGAVTAARGVGEFTDDG